MDLGFWQHLDELKNKVASFHEEYMGKVAGGAGPVRNDSTPYPSNVAGARTEQADWLEAQNPGIWSGAGNWRVPNGRPVPGMTLDKMPELTNKPSERPKKTWY